LEAEMAMGPNFLIQLNPTHPPQIFVNTAFYPVNIYTSAFYRHPLTVK